MPKKSMKKCNDFSCGNLTHDSYCDKHKKDSVENRQKSDREYKKYRKDKKEQAFYSSREWIALRDWQRNRKPYCEMCYEYGKVTPVDVIDHKIPIKEDYSLRLSNDNVQSLCMKCHNKKSADDRKKYNLSKH